MEFAAWSADEQGIWSACIAIILMAKYNIVVIRARTDLLESARRVYTMFTCCGRLLVAAIAGKDHARGIQARWCLWKGTLWYRPRGVVLILLGCGGVARRCCAF